MSLRLSLLSVLGLALGLASTAAAWPRETAGGIQLSPPRIREWEVPQPPLVIERPPRVFREITQTFEVTPRPAVEVLELPADRTYFLPAAQVAPWRVPVTSFRTGLHGRRLNVVYSDGRTVQFGPLGRPRFDY
jgi:hypothetical protein